MRRSYGLSGPISCARPLERAFSARNVRHLLQLRVLALAVALAVDDEPPALVDLLPKHRGDDVLQRGERFALTADQQRAVLAGQVDAQAVGHLLGFGLEMQPHRGNDFLDELTDFAQVWPCSHLAWSRSGAFASLRLGHRSAARTLLRLSADQSDSS